MIGRGREDLRMRGGVYMTPHEAELWLVCEWERKKYSTDNLRVENMLLSTRKKIFSLIIC